MPQSSGRLAPSQYTFVPSNRQINFAGVPGFTLDGLVEIWHGPSGKTIYSGYDTSGLLGGTLAGSILSMQYDTSAMGANDRLFIIYNALERDDQLLVYSPTATGPLTPVACRSFQSAVLDVQSATGINGALEGTVDGTQWKAITGMLPNLDNNPGDTNWSNGSPYNMRQYDITPYYYIRLNVNGYSAGTPKLNLLLKTIPAPPRKFIANGGSLVANFDSGGSVGYVRTTSCYTEQLRQKLLAGAVYTGASRQAFGWPNPYYPRFEAIVVTDQPGTIVFMISDDNVNWIALKTVPVPGNGYFTDYVRCCANFHRAVYTNGSTDTGANAFTFKTAFTVG